MTQKSKKNDIEVVSSSTQNDEDFQIIQQLRHFSGPLPSPDILINYDRVIPGAANRIIEMAEKNQDSRLFINKIMAESDVKKSLRSKFLAWHFFAFKAAVDLQGGKKITIYR